MSSPERHPAGPAKRTRAALAQDAGTRARAGSEISESFRSARSAIDQIAADFERLRHHAASLVKGAARTAK